MNIDRSCSDRPSGAEEVPRNPFRRLRTVAPLARIGSFHQTRISFVRSLVWQMAREGWRIKRKVFDIDASKSGHARFAVHIPHGRYSGIFFTEPGTRFLASEMETSHQRGAGGGNDAD